MARLNSLENEISSIRFVPFPTRSTKKVVKLVRVDSMIVADLGNGTVACSRELKHFSYPITLSGTPWVRNLLDALHRLGVISEKAWGSHLAEARKRDEERSFKYRSGDLRDAAKALGIKLTREQTRKLAPLPVKKATAA